MLKIALKSVGLGVLATLLMHLQLVGLLVVVVATPLLMLVPALGTTGADVDIGFAWIGLKSTFAWAAFVGYFSALFYLLLTVRHRMKTKKMNKIA